MSCVVFFFFFNDTATTEIYTLSLHDALPIYAARRPTQPGRSHDPHRCRNAGERLHLRRAAAEVRQRGLRSEEHTSELQSRQYLVCRLLLEKKKTHQQITETNIQHVH